MALNSDAAPRGAIPFSYPLAILSALALVTASAGFGAHFAWHSNQSHGPMLAGCAVVMALGLEASKPLAVHSLFDALRHWRLGQALALFVLAAVATGYSLTAELQLMALSRADAVAGRSHDTGTATEARGKLASLRGELATIVPARGPAEIEPLIAAKLATTQGANCSSKSLSDQMRAVCNDLAALRSERARWATRDDLQKRIDAAETSARQAGAVKVADPSATALSTYLQAFGVHVAPERLGDWFVLVGVLALEAGSMFALTLVAACRPNTETSKPRVVSSETLAAPLVNTPRNAETPALPAPAQLGTPATETLKHAVSTEPAKLTVATDPAERLVSVLREKGGELFASQRALALLVGVSPSSANRLVRDLETAGTLTATKDKAGTRLRLA